MLDILRPPEVLDDLILGSKTVFPGPQDCSEGPTGENEDLEQAKTPVGYVFPMVLLVSWDFTFLIIKI